ncbi:biotin--[acetyl-CoA-carboxylase] ligase [Spirochaetia bacterium 38H-sp]|uniref:Biotin--[acetyl-CoA-carboxylase] ligase n=1 Tax=Rarispira pelagica TaxID=3141764 RepID=A0ABU9UBK3_9SPIR
MKQVNLTRKNILSALRETSDAVSGQLLAEKLGLSRVAVWKHINSLIEKGYGIESTPKGYVLTNDGDFLYPWEFDSRLSVFWQHKCSSTMDIARKLVEEESEHYDIVISDKQDKGRGRYGHSWIYTDKSIATTFILKKSIAMQDIWKVLFAASLAVSEELEVDGIKTSIHWPNDIYAGDKKVAGILMDISAEYMLATNIRIGIGINTGKKPDIDNATSVKIRRKRADFISCVFFRLTELIEADKNSITTKVKNKSDIWGKEIEVHSFGKRIRGIAKDIGKNGELILENKNKERINISDGICTIG